jgi:hypothetical protein
VCWAECSVPAIAYTSACGIAQVKGGAPLFSDCSHIERQEASETRRCYVGYLIELRLLGGERDANTNRKRDL